jgi:peptidyl-prolyl cis-trans isomerase D
MLQAINDRIKGWLGIAVVAIIALPFAFWGIQSYTGNGAQQYAAKIDDIEISPRELEYNVSQQRQRLLQQYNGQLPFEESQLKEQVLNQLINQKLIEIISYQNGYRISDAELSSNIKKLFSQDGEFNRLLFDSVRQSQGKSAAQFEHALRNELRVIQIRDGIVKSGFASNTEARKAAELEAQSREISLVTFNLEDFSQGVSISDEEIQDAYEAESRRYMSPEKVSIEYVELKSDILSGAVTVDERQIKEMYDEYVANLSLKVKRKASHILLKVGPDKEATKKQLEDFRQQLESGASFSEIAREHSQDPVSGKQGGDLGWIEPGQMVKPFENALFALDEGEVSNVVESQFGMHLIKLDKIQREPLKSLAEMRGEFEQTLKLEAASNMFYDLSENMATAAFENPDSLGAVVDIMNLKLQTSDFFTRDSGTGIAANELVRKAAFAINVLQQGNNSDIIELSPEHVIVLRINQHVASSVRPFDEVKSSIENVLRLRKGHDLTLAAGISAKEKIESGQTINSVLSSNQKIERPGPIKRNDMTRVDRKILDAAFSMYLPEDGKVAAKEVALDSGDVVLVVLEKVNKPESIDYSRLDIIKRQLGQDIAEREFLASLESLKDSADINRNPKALQ